MKKTKFFKKQKIFIDQIIDILEKSEDYKAFVKTDERYKEMMEHNNQLTIWGITFFDTYDNKGMNKLVKGISKLNKDKYNVDLTLRPKRFKDLNYLELQYDYTSTPIGISILIVGIGLFILLVSLASKFSRKYTSIKKWV